MAMSEETPSPTNQAPLHGDQDDQLRAISFRMREIQRLLAMRVEQENRRLAADGLDRVTETRFRESPEQD